MDKVQSVQPHQSSIGGISANILAMLCFLAVMLFRTVGLIAVLAVFFIEKNSGFVKFHAMQATLLFVARSVAVVLLDIPSRALSWSERFSMGGFFFGIFRWSGNLALSLISAAVEVGMIVLCILGAVNAYRWRRWPVPLLGAFAESLYTKGDPARYDTEGDPPEDMRPPAADDPAAPPPPPAPDTPPTPDEENPS